MLLSHQAKQSSSSHARCTLPSVAENPQVLQTETCTATLNVTVCLLHNLHWSTFNFILFNGDDLKISCYNNFKKMLILNSTQERNYARIFRAL